MKLVASTSTRCRSSTCRPAACTRRSIRPSPPPAGQQQRSESTEHPDPAGRPRNSAAFTPRGLRDFRDYSQIELRVLAHFPATPPHRRFQQGVDIHDRTADRVPGGRPAASIRKNPPARRSSTTLLYGKRRSRSRKTRRSRRPRRISSTYWATHRCAVIDDARRCRESGVVRIITGAAAWARS